MEYSEIAVKMVTFNSTKYNEIRRKSIHLELKFNRKGIKKIAEWKSKVQVNITLHKPT